MNGMVIMFLFLCVLVAGLLVPFLGIWAVNTLFGLHIAFTFKTWCAAFIIIGIIEGPAISTRKSN